MSRRNNKRNTINNEPLEKEYKDENLTNPETEDFPDDIVNETPENYNEDPKCEVIENIDKSSMYESNMGTLHFDLKLSNDALIKEKPDHKAKILLVRELDKNDLKYISNIPDYSMAYIPKGTNVTCYEVGNGWYALNKGYIYIGDYVPHVDDPRLDAAITKIAGNGLTRMNEVKRHLENGGN